MFPRLLEALDKTSIEVFGLIGYYILFLGPSLKIGNSLVKNLSRTPVPWWNAGLLFLLFLVFTFPTMLFIYLYLFA